MKDQNIDINDLNEIQKINYIKKLFFDNNVNDALNILLKDEKRNLLIIKGIIKVTEDTYIKNKIKTQCDFADTKIYVYSKILSILFFYDKSAVLDSFLRYLNKDELKDLALYEYKNKTTVSQNSKIFNRYCINYKINNDNTEVLEFEDSKMIDKKGKKSNRKIFKVSLIIVLIIIVILFALYCFNCVKLVNNYNSRFLPDIYLNNINLGGKNISSLDKVVLSEKDKILNSIIVAKNINNSYQFSYEKANIFVDENEIINEIKKYNRKLSFIDKLKRIKHKSYKKKFYLKAAYDDDDETINNFISLLEKEMNTEVRNDGIIIDDAHNVTYDYGINGFTVDKDKTSIKLKSELSNLKENMIIDIPGKVIKKEVKYNYLKDINKKISSHTTYFVNSGNRGHNITLASSRLNGTIINKMEEFSYLKVVGPYGASNGYLPAPIYLNSEVTTANGGGVCQLASTLYMAQLKAGLKTISRRNHTFAPDYVPKGLDATVYSTTTDYKFKNEYNYPIYIVSYVSGNYLTVDIWSNENALEGKSFEPYSVASNGGWLAYLRIKKDGKVIETKYLDRSVYKAH